MPIKNNKRKRGQGRRIARKRVQRMNNKANFSNRLSVLRLYQPSCIPDEAYIPFKYQTNASTNGTTASYLINFAMNDLFDPNATTSGHQPLGFTQWMAFYNNFQVKSSSLECQVLNPTTDNVPFCFTVFPNVSTTAQGAVRDKEQSYAKFVYVGGQTFGNQVARLKHHMDVAKFEGFPINSPNYCGSAALSPTYTRYWSVQAQPLDLTTNIYMMMDVTIIYYARLFKRVNLSEDTVDDEKITPENFKYSDNLRESVVVSPRIDQLPPLQKLVRYPSKSTLK
jgi:hypothetical protein